MFIFPAYILTENFNLSKMYWHFGSSRTLLDTGLTLLHVCGFCYTVAPETYLLNYFTYLLTLWSRVLEKLTGFQLFKKFPAFYGTRRFITAFTRTRHLSLS